MRWSIISFCLILFLRNVSQLEAVMKRSRSYTNVAKQRKTSFSKHTRGLIKTSTVNGLYRGYKVAKVHRRANRFFKKDKIWNEEDHDALQEKQVWNNEVLLDDTDKDADSSTSSQATMPTPTPTTENQTRMPTSLPTRAPYTENPTKEPTAVPRLSTKTSLPTKAAPTKELTAAPTADPTKIPNEEPTNGPTKELTKEPASEPEDHSNSLQPDSLIDSSANGGDGGKDNGLIIDTNRKFGPFIGFVLIVGGAVGIFFFAFFVAARDKGGTKDKDSTSTDVLSSNQVQILCA